jgi:hypothetical protein
MISIKAGIWSESPADHMGCHVASRRVKGSCRPETPAARFVLAILAMRTDVLFFAEQAAGEF